MGMTEKFTNAIEARSYMDGLLKQIRNCDYSVDIRVLWKNCDKMVDELSSIEVRCRQRNNWTAADDYRAKMHESCDYIEKLIIMLTLMSSAES
jgi:hypothetical protein